MDKEENLKQYIITVWCDTHITCFLKILTLAQNNNLNYIIVIINLAILNREKTGHDSRRKGASAKLWYLRVTAVISAKKHSSKIVIWMRKCKDNVFVGIQN